MKKIFIILIGLILLVACSNKTNESEEKKQEDTKEIETDTTEMEQVAEITEPIEYDELQQWYLDIDESTTYEKLIEELESSNLYHNEKKSNGGIENVKVAFEEGVTKFNRPDSGDYVEVFFNKNMDIETVEYFNNDIFITLIDYRHGTYWDFRDQPEYAGYYINTYNNKAGSFTIKYENGNEAETDYLKVDSKEEQFEYMYKYAETE